MLAKIYTIKTAIKPEIRVLTCMFVALAMEFDIFTNLISQQGKCDASHVHYRFKLD